MRTRILKIFVLIGFIFSVIFIIYQISIQDTCIDYYKNEKLRSYSGVVKEKYIDREQHNYKILVIRNSDTTINKQMDADRSGLFEYIQVNDSIVKLKDSYEVYVYQKSGNDTVFYIDYKCKND